MSWLLTIRSQDVFIDVINHRIVTERATVHPEQWLLVWRRTAGSPPANSCVLVSLPRRDLWRDSRSISASNGQIWPALPRNLFTVSAKKTDDSCTMGVSKQPFSMRSRCVVTWLGGCLSVWLSCDAERQRQVKELRRLFCGWTTCWSRIWMRAGLTFPGEPTGFKRGEGRPRVMYCDTSWRSAGLNDTAKYQFGTFWFHLHNSKRIGLQWVLKNLNEKSSSDISLTLVHSQMSFQSSINSLMMHIIPYMCLHCTIATASVHTSMKHADCCKHWRSSSIIQNLCQQWEKFQLFIFSVI